MKVIAFITDFSVVDRIINRLKLTFIAAKPPLILPMKRLTKRVR